MAAENTIAIAPIRACACAQGTRGSRTWSCLEMDARWSSRWTARTTPRSAGTCGPKPRPPVHAVWSPGRANGRGGRPGRSRARRAPARGTAPSSLPSLIALARDGDCPPGHSEDVRMMLDPPKVRKNAHTAPASSGGRPHFLESGSTWVRIGEGRTPNGARCRAGWGRTRDVRRFPVRGCPGWLIEPSCTSKAPVEEAGGLRCCGVGAPTTGLIASSTSRLTEPRDIALTSPGTRGSRAPDSRQWRPSILQSGPTHHRARHTSVDLHHDDGEGTGKGSCRHRGSAPRCLGGSTLSGRLSSPLPGGGTQPGRTDA